MRAWTPGSNATHGLASTYRSGGCRCDECRAASTKRHREEWKRRVARLAADSTLVEHGTVNAYENWGCRCDPCKAAWSQAMRTPERREIARRSRERVRARRSQETGESL